MPNRQAEAKADRRCSFQRAASQKRFEQPAGFIKARHLFQIDQNMPAEHEPHDPAAVALAPANDCAIARESRACRGRPECSGRIFKCQPQENPIRAWSALVLDKPTLRPRRAWYRATAGNPSATPLQIGPWMMAVSSGCTFHPMAGIGSTENTGSHSTFVPMHHARANHPDAPALHCVRCAPLPVVGLPPEVMIIRHRRQETGRSAPRERSCPSATGSQRLSPLWPSGLSTKPARVWAICAAG